MFFLNMTLEKRKKKLKITSFLVEFVPMDRIYDTIVNFKYRSAFFNVAFSIMEKENGNGEKLVRRLNIVDANANIRSNATPTSYWKLNFTRQVF